MKRSFCLPHSSLPDQTNPGIDGNGLIAEHWDPSETWVDGKPPGAEFFAEWDK